MVILSIVDDKGICSVELMRWSARKRMKTSLTQMQRQGHMLVFGTLHERRDTRSEPVVATLIVQVLRSALPTVMYQRRNPLWKASVSTDLRVSSAANVSGSPHNLLLELALDRPQPSNKRCKCMALRPTQAFQYILCSSSSTHSSQHLQQTTSSRGFLPLYGRPVDVYSACTWKLLPQVARQIIEISRIVCTKENGSIGM